MEATRILAWTPNRIKLAEDGLEIGAYLLDPRQSESDADQAAEDLKGIFRDLALHQVGLVAGLRECVRGVLSQFDPASFEEEVRNDSPRAGLLKRWRSITCVFESAAWRRFKRRHRQFSEEEVKVFERILAPYFAKGYLSVQKAKNAR